MSASLPSLLADELNTSDEQAKKLLIAMLREVKKRARREGVRLPEFGTFRESDGEITFEPSPSLARTVNHRFEGLQSEDLTSAPEEETEDEDDGGPNTITLGYQDSDWSPLDSEETETEEAGSADEEEADTEEFQVPSADEAPDTDAFEAPDTDSSDATSSQDATSDRESTPSETEELYPLVEDVPEGASEEADAASSESEDDDLQEEERDSLSGIWGDEEEKAADEEGEVSFEQESGGAESEPAEAPEREDGSDGEAATDPNAPTTEVEIEPEAQEAASSDETSPSDAESTSTGARVAVGLLVFLLLGGAGWYVLGQRGTVKPPRVAFAQLQTTVQSQVDALSAQVSKQDLPLIGSTDQQPPSAQANVPASSSDSSPSSPADSDESVSPSPTDGTSPSSSSETTSEPTSSSEEASTSAEPTSSESNASSAQGLRPAEGGWTVIVASRTQQSPAQSLVQKYRRAFENQNVPVGILTGTVENTTRYRIGVGQFQTQSAVQSFLNDAGAKLPEGAWPLRLQ